MVFKKCHTHLSANRVVHTRVDCVANVQGFHSLVDGLLVILHPVGVLDVSGDLHELELVHGFHGVYDCLHVPFGLIDNGLEVLVKILKGT